MYYIGKVKKKKLKAKPKPKPVTPARQLMPWENGYVYPTDPALSEKERVIVNAWEQSDPGADFFRPVTMTSVAKKHQELQKKMLVDLEEAKYIANQMAAKSKNAKVHVKTKKGTVAVAAEEFEDRIKEILANQKKGVPPVLLIAGLAAAFLLGSKLLK